MKPKEMETEWVHKSYWDEFHKLYPDPSAFRSFIALDPALTKMFNFCFAPSIWDIKKFPFDEKIKELETLTEDDRDYLTEAYWKEKDKQNQDWLEYLENMFDMVHSTILLKKKLDSDNPEYNQEQILERVENDFRDFISIIDTTTRDNREYIWRRGTWYPRFTRVVHRKGREIAAKIYHHSPNPKDIEESFQWTAYWVKTYQKHRFDDLFDSPAKTFTIQHYYDGKPLLKEPFKVPIAQKFEPLLKVSAKKMKKNLRGDFEAALQEARLALLEAIKEYGMSHFKVEDFS